MNFTGGCGFGIQNCFCACTFFQWVFCSGPISISSLVNTCASYCKLVAFSFPTHLVGVAILPPRVAVHSPVAPVSSPCPYHTSEGAGCVPDSKDGPWSQANRPDDTGSISKKLCEPRNISNLIEPHLSGVWMEILVSTLREHCEEFKGKPPSRSQHEPWHIIHNANVCCLPIPTAPIFDCDGVSYLNNITTFWQVFETVRRREPHISIHLT